MLSPNSPISIVTWSTIYVATENFNLSNRIRKRERKTESVDSLVRLMAKAVFPHLKLKIICIYQEQNPKWILKLEP